ncbi:MAG: hypothetical protein ACI35O_08900 [Bacillaceae bacterium]
MKKILLLSHDLGGFDVIYPTYTRLKELGEQVLLSCVGPAGQLKGNFQCKEDEFFSKLKSLVYKKKVKGLVTSTSLHSKIEVEAIKFCKEQGVKTVAILDYWISYAWRFRLNDDTYVYPDYYIVMDHVAYEEAIAAGVPKECLIILGHPGLDSIISKSKTKEILRKEGGPRVLFLSQPISLVYGDEKGYTEYTVLRDLENMNLDYSVKFHPKEDAIVRELYEKREITGSLSQLLPSIDLVVGMSTMGMLHACIFGKPTISYQPDLKGRDFAVTNRLGLTKLYTDYEELELFFDQFQREPVIYMNSLQPINSFLWSDGKSTERVAGFIKGILQ